MWSVKFHTLEYMLTVYVHVTGQMRRPTLESSNLVNQCLESLCLWMAYRVGKHNCTVHSSTYTTYMHNIYIFRNACMCGPVSCTTCT